jgi:hypothetical protein
MSGGTCLFVNEKATPTLVPQQRFVFPGQGQVARGYGAHDARTNKSPSNRFFCCMLSCEVRQVLEVSE